LGKRGEEERGNGKNLKDGGERVRRKEVSGRMAMEKHCGGGRTKDSYSSPLAGDQNARNKGQGGGKKVSFPAHETLTKILGELFSGCVKKSGHCKTPLG